MLRFKNTILPNKAGSNKLLFAVMWFPASEKSRSEATEVAGIPKYFRAIIERTGKISCFDFHQSNGFLFSLATGKRN